MRKLRAPAYELSHAAASFHVSLRDYLVRSAESPPSVGRRFELSPFGPRVYFVFRKRGTAVGAIATQIDDVSGRGEPDLLLEETWEIGGPGGVFRTRGNGTVPGGGFPCNVDPGGLREESETISHVLSVAGRAGGILGDGLY